MCLSRGQSHCPSPGGKSDLEAPACLGEECGQRVLRVGGSLRSCLIWREQLLGEVWWDLQRGLSLNGRDVPFVWSIFKRIVCVKSAFGNSGLWS